MLKVHTTNGKTHKIDLRDEKTANEWARRLVDPAFQATISSMSISQRGSQYTLGRPLDFRESDIHFAMEEIKPEGKWQGGEEITGFFGDVRVSMLVHNSQRAARVMVTRTGKRIHIPDFA
jgi:hypothetical protein